MESFEELEKNLKNAKPNQKFNEARKNIKNMEVKYN